MTESMNKLSSILISAFEQISDECTEGRLSDDESDGWWELPDIVDPLRSILSEVIRECSDKILAELWSLAHAEGILSSPLAAAIRIPLDTEDVLHEYCESLLTSLDAATDRLVRERISAGDTAAEIRAKLFSRSGDLLNRVNTIIQTERNRLDNLTRVQLFRKLGIDKVIWDSGAEGACEAALRNAQLPPAVLGSDAYENTAGNLICNPPGCLNCSCRLLPATEDVQKLAKLNILGQFQLDVSPYEYTDPNVFVTVDIPVDIANEMELGEPYGVTLAYIGSTTMLCRETLEETIKDICETLRPFELIVLSKVVLGKEVVTLDIGGADLVVDSFWRKLKWKDINNPLEKQSPHIVLTLTSFWNDHPIASVGRAWMVRDLKLRWGDEISSFQLSVL